MNRALNRYVRLSSMLLMLLLAGGVAAQEYAKGSEVLMKKLAKLIPELEISSVTQTPMEGFFLVELDSGQSLYGSADGEFLFSGDLYRLTDRVENLAEQRRQTKRSNMLAKQSLNDMVVFSPKGPAKTHITVFTDVDCGYCRKLHQEIAQINDLGIEVRYMGYPRAGLGTPTHAKIVSAWCADDPQQAMTQLKAGQTIPAATCENPIAEQFELGRQIGVTGTPAIVTADGRLLPGYMPAEVLADAIGL